MLIDIHEERADDAAAVREVNRRAFGQDQEADLVDALRANGAILLSLVASLNGRVVGHVLYTPVSIAGEVTGAGLGPMAVLPEHQRRGIGSRLIDAGIRHLRAAGCAFIVVLGHPEYYPRFGFRPASARGIRCQWDAPAEAFMVLVLDEARMGGVVGLARYREEFSMV